MKSLILAVVAMVSLAVPAQAEDNVIEPTLLEKHPVYAKLSAPFRAVVWRPLVKGIKVARIDKMAGFVGDVAKTAGVKTQPYHPFMNLCTTGTQFSITAATWFRR